MLEFRLMTEACGVLPHANSSIKCGDQERREAGRASSQKWSNKKEQIGRQSFEQRLEGQHTSHPGREMQRSGEKFQLLLPIAPRSVAHCRVLNIL